MRRCRGVDGPMTDRTDILRAYSPGAADGGRRHGHWPYRSSTGHRRPQAPVAVEGPEGVVLVRLGQLGFLHHCSLGPLRAVHGDGRRQGRRLRRRRRHVQQDGRPARPAPRGGLAAVLPDQLRHDRERVRAADRRRVRGPLAPQEVAHGRLCLGRLVLLRAAVLHAGRQLAAGCVRGRAGEHPGRLLAGLLLRDPRRHLHRGGARPRLLARLGVRATSAAACSWP